VRRLIPLAFLSPAIVQAIAEGRHPADLTGEALSRGIDIPVDWSKQGTALGFESSRGGLASRSADLHPAVVD